MGTEQGINMVEAGAKEVSEDDMLEALMFEHDAIKRLCAFEKKIAKVVGKEKRPLNIYKIDEKLVNYCLNYVSEGQKKTHKERLIEACSIKDK